MLKKEGIRDLKKSYMDYNKEHWTHLLQNCCYNGDDVKEYLNLTDDETDRINKISEQYPMCINHYYLSLINPEDPEDPIRKMSIPSGWELSDGGEPDTSGEASNTVIPGMQHKYDQTTLILSTNMCAMYCRHCFRKRLVGLSDDEIAGHLGEMEEYVRSHPEVSRIVEAAAAMQNGQGKCVHYAMSHPTGKIEILGQLDGDVMLFKYHQAKNSGEIGRIFTVAVKEDQCWLDKDLN